MVIRPRSSWSRLFWPLVVTCLVTFAAGPTLAQYHAPPTDSITRRTNQPPVRTSSPARYSPPVHIAPGHHSPIREMRSLPPRQSKRPAAHLSTERTVAPIRLASHAAAPSQPRSSGTLAQPTPATQDIVNETDESRSVLNAPDSEGFETGSRPGSFGGEPSMPVDLSPAIDLEGYQPESTGRSLRGTPSDAGAGRGMSRANELRRTGIRARESSYARPQEDQNPLDKTCDDFRTELLNNPITSIELNISPARSEQPGEGGRRDWTSPDGTVWASGTLVDLRNGYVIVQTDTGTVKIPYARLSDPDWAAISQQWRLPLECGIGGIYEPRMWVPQTYTWTASSLCHKPLYFENIQLERYGHSHGPFLQPVHSAAHFFISLASWPYQATIHPANECQYALGFYRPGNCAPWLRYPIPFSTFGTQYRGY